MGNIRRILAGAGLVAILWIGVQLVQGSLSLPDAGLRAFLALLSVIVVSRLAEAGFKALLHTLN